MIKGTHVELGKSLRSAVINPRVRLMNAFIEGTS